MGTSLLAVVILAQMPWTTNLPTRGISLDVLRPKFQGVGTSFASIAAYASGRIPTGNMAIRFELPFARGSTEFSGSSSTLGNPYLGVAFGGETGLSFDGGFRVPIASDGEFAAQIGAFSDFTRFEAFVPDLATAAVRARYRVHNANGFTFDVGGGPSLWIPTGDNSGDPDVVLHHHMLAGYRGPTAWFSLGFGGITIITEDIGGVGERTINELGASLGMATGQVRPAIHAIVPLDDEYNSSVGIVLGFGVAIVLP